MCDRVVLKLPRNPVELKIIYYMQNVSYVEGKHIPGSWMKTHLQVHNEFKPSNRAVNDEDNIFKYTMNLNHLIEQSIPTYIA